VGVSNPARSNADIKGVRFVYHAPKSDSKDVPVTEAAEVRHMLGDVDDEIVSEILRLEPMASELETAVAYLRGEGDAFDRTGHPLSGKAAQVFEILDSSETLPDQERR
jgi:hypothetical protein